MPNRAAVSRLMSSVSMVALLCWSVVTSRAAAGSCSFVSSFGAHVFELVEVDVLQRVLVLRRVKPAADL